MLEIADHPEGILQKDISVNQAISLKYLDHITASLKAAGLIIRIHTNKGGYKLTRAPEDITVYDVYKAFEYELVIDDCCENGDDCLMIGKCKTRNFWCELNSTMIKHMESETISGLLSGYPKLKN